MLIGLREEENERQVKAKKSQIYREMLDHQIMMNEQYRKDKSKEKDFDQSPQFYVAPSFVHKSTQPIEHSHAKQNSQKRYQEKQRFLPLIKDKNTFYRGSSKFLKVDESSKQKRSPKHIKTQQIQEENESEDGYNTTCERIIRQLQGISSKPVKFRNKRKLLDKSGGQLAPKHLNSRNNPSDNKNLFQWLDKPMQANYNNKPIKAQNIPESNSKKVQNNSDNRNSRIISADLNGMQKQPNQFDQSHAYAKGKHKKSDSLAEEASNQFIEDRKQNIKNRKEKEFNPETKTKNKDRVWNHDEEKTASKANRYQSTKNDKEGTKSKQDNYETQKNKRPPQTSSLQRSESKRYNPSQTPTHNNRENRQTFESNKQRDQQSKQAQRKQMHRQNFLQLLRKVKNRGESLYIKMAKYPSEKQLQNN